MIFIWWLWLTFGHLEYNNVIMNACVNIQCIYCWTNELHDRCDLLVGTLTLLSVHSNLLFTCWGTSAVSRFNSNFLPAFQSFNGTIRICSCLIYICKVVCVLFSTSCSLEMSISCRGVCYIISGYAHLLKSFQQKLRILK